MCTECERKIRSFHAFKSETLQSQSKFNKFIENNLKASSFETKIDKLVKNESFEQKLEIIHLSTEPNVGNSKAKGSTENLQHNPLSHNKMICSICGTLLANKTSLNRHMKRIHLNVRSFSCDLCDYKGLFKSNIAEHVNKYAY